MRIFVLVSDSFPLNPLGAMFKIETMMFKIETIMFNIETIMFKI